MSPLSSLASGYSSWVLWYHWVDLSLVCGLLCFTALLEQKSRSSPEDCRKQTSQPSCFRSKTIPRSSVETCRDAANTAPTRLRYWSNLRLRANERLPLPLRRSALCSIQQQPRGHHRWSPLHRHTVRCAEHGTHCRQARTKTYYRPLVYCLHGRRCHPDRNE